MYNFILAKRNNNFNNRKTIKSFVNFLKDFCSTYSVRIFSSTTRSLYLSGIHAFFKVYAWSNKTKADCNHKIE